jgi:hypothetical protein
VGEEYGDGECEYEEWWYESLIRKRLESKLNEDMYPQVYFVSLDMIYRPHYPIMYPYFFHR